MKKVFPTLFALFCMCINVLGQADFKLGFILPTANDTITGLIDYRNDIFNAEQCCFKHDSNDLKIYKPFEIYGYCFIDGKFYVSKYIRKGEKITPSFVEYLVKGKKNLYYQRDDSGSRFLIDFDNDTVIEVVYKVDKVYQDGVEFISNSKLHQGYLKAYFRDCPAVYPEIEKIEMPDFSNMISLTREYHHITCSDTGCVVYYKKPYKFKFDLEFRFGIINYPKNSKSFNPQYSGLIHFWLPRSNERMYIITGIVYSSLNINDTAYSVYKIPLKFEYLFPFRVVKPRFEGGFNFMMVSQGNRLSGFEFTFPISAGVLICPVSFIGIDLSVEGELLTIANFQETESYQMGMAYSFNAGICFRF